MNAVSPAELPSATSQILIIHLILQGYPTLQQIVEWRPQLPIDGIHAIGELFLIGKPPIVSWVLFHIF